MAAPKGLRYREHLISEAEGETLLARFEALAFHEVAMRGQVARRTVAHFGFRYAFEGGALEPTEPIPAWLLPLREVLAEMAGEPPGRFEQALVTRYPPGAGIGWHRDAPAFDTPILGFTLLGPARLRFREGSAGRSTFELGLPSRAGYVLGGVARWRWQHQVPPVKTLRYAVTFRPLRRGRAG